MKNLFALLIVVVVFSCGEDPKPAMTDVEEAMISVDPPPSAQITRSGIFSSFAHSLAGNCGLYIDDKSNKTLRLENFTMTMGPDVYVFVSKSNNYSKANVITIGKLSESYSNDGLNLKVDSTINLDDYKFVLVYCVQYNSLFGYTELK
jgi:hypothetical protein